MSDRPDNTSDLDLSRFLMGARPDVGDCGENYSSKA
jgi:hypothetical protein